MKSQFTGILFFLLQLSLSAQFGEAFTVDYPQRLRIIDSIYTSFLLEKQSYSAIHSNLGELKELANLKKDDISLLMYSVLEQRTKLYEDSSSIDQKVATFLKVVHEVDINGHRLIEAHALLYLAQILKEKGRGGTSLSYMMRAFDLANNESGNEILVPQMIALRIAGILYLLGDYPKAKEYAIKSFADKMKGHRKMLSYDLLSQISLKLGQYDSSSLYIKKCIEVYVQEDTTRPPIKGWRGIMYGYEGKIHYAKNEIEQAIPFFRNALPILVDAAFYNNILSFSIRLAESYLMTGKTVEARALLPTMEKAISRNTDEQNFLDYYKLRVLLGEKNQSVSRISVVLDSILFWSQKINQQKDQNALIRHEMDFEIKAYKEREEELARNINRQLFIRSVLWKILGFFVLIATFIFYYKQKQIRQQKRESQKSLEEAARELALAHEQLNDFKNSLIEKSKRLEILESEVELTANDQDLENLRVKTILTEGEWVKFKELFERVHTGYFTRLKSRFPGLTQGEIRFFALIKLSFTNKDMAATLGVGPGAIRTMKSRLLKKLDLDGKLSLEEVVEEI
ncbi:MAG: hypothetical protein IPN15_00185 [Saprospiraceae bacterium]|nr:hypothetical protein [Candidatus Vicinibacter affinis]